MTPFERELLRAYDACNMSRVKAAKKLGMRDDLTKLLYMIDKEESDEL